MAGGQVGWRQVAYVARSLMGARVGQMAQLQSGSGVMDVAGGQVGYGAGGEGGQTG